MKSQFSSPFIPDRLKSDQLESLFVHSEDVVSEVLQLIRRWVLTRTGGRILLIGSRGIGKTHFLAIVCQRLRRMGDLQLLIATPQTENWGMTTLRDLLLAVLRSLSVEVGGFLQMNSHRAEDAAFESLSRLAQEHTLLVRLDNLRDLFSNFADSGQRRFRNFLDANPGICILAASPGDFEGLTNPEAPFAGCFEVRRLEEISQGAVARLVSSLASLQQDSELTEFVPTPLGQMRLNAIRRLAGGNPGAFVTLSPFLSRGSLEDLTGALVRIIQDANFHYLKCITALTPSERKVFDLICEADHPVNDAELLGGSQLDPDALALATAKLCRLDYLQATRIGTEDFYQPHDPFFRICHEFRINPGKPPRVLMQFLRSWHAAAGMQTITDLPDEETLQLDSDFPAVSPGKNEALVPGSPDCDSWQAHAWTELRQGHMGKALEAIDRAIELGGGHRAVACRALILTKSGRLIEALESCAEITRACRDDALSWMIQGVAFSGLGCFEKSATVLTRLSVLKPDSPCAISLLAAALINCQRYQEGLAQAVRAVELGPEDPSAWVLKGLALTRLDRDSDALACFEQASSLGLKSPAVLLMRAQLLFVLARWREGAERLDSALLQYSRLSEPDAGDTGAILRNLIATSNNATILRLCIKVLVHVYGRHKLLAPLAYGLLDCIPDITSPGCIDTAAKKWLRSWQAVAGALPEFRFPLRLLESAVRYRRTSDSRILMELSREERKLLQILAGLQIDEGLLLFESHEDGVALTNP